MLRVIGAGLSRTGTLSLHEALKALGHRSVHYDDVRLSDVLEGSVSQPDFRRYDDIDAVSDLPTALFYRELMEAYPESKVVLTIRDVESWWASVRKYFNRVHPISDEPSLGDGVVLGLRLRPLKEPFRARYRRLLRNLAYGSVTPKEFLYKKRYMEHNELVRATVSPERLLVLDVSAGEGWSKLCPFLGVSTPVNPFPHVNRS